MPCRKKFLNSSTEVTVGSAIKCHQRIKEWERRLCREWKKKKPEKAEFLMVTLCARGLERRGNGSACSSQLTTAQHPGEAAGKLPLRHPWTHHPQQCSFIRRLTRKILQMSHQDRDWFITWYFSKQNLFHFTKPKRNKRAAKHETEGRKKRFHFGLRKK